MTTTKKLDELEKNKKAAAADTVSGGGALPVTGYKAPASQNQSAAGEQNPRVTALRQYLENTVGGTPTESDLLKNVRAKLMNRTGFTYDHNNDPRFQQYFETAKRSGKMAMQDTMGQAASLTGGYANSWAQTAGQAAYNSYLQDANEMIPEFEELARARYDAETAALGDQYAILKGEHDEALEDYWNRYSIAREDWYTEQDRQTAEKQYEDEKKQREIELLLAMGDYDALDKMGYNTSALRQDRSIALASAYASDEDDEEEEEPIALWNYSKTVTTDSDGNEYYTYNSTDGKSKKVSLGVNPYNGAINKDILDKNGNVDPSKLFRKETKDEKGKTVYTYSNTYQPNNINGDPLEKTGDRTNVNGRDQAIWKTSDGRLWVWDGSLNEYRKIEWVD